MDKIVYQGLEGYQRAKFSPQPETLFQHKILIWLSPILKDLVCKLRTGILSFQHQPDPLTLRPLVEGMADSVSDQQVVFFSGLNNNSTFTPNIFHVNIDVIFDDSIKHVLKVMVSRYS